MQPKLITKTIDLTNFIDYSLSSKFANTTTTQTRQNDRIQSLLIVIKRFVSEHVFLVYDPSLRHILSFLRTFGIIPVTIKETGFVTISKIKLKVHSFMNLLITSEMTLQDALDYCLSVEDSCLRGILNDALNDVKDDSGLLVQDTIINEIKELFLTSIRFWFCLKLFDIWLNSIKSNIRQPPSFELIVFPAILYSFNLMISDSCLQDTALYLLMCLTSQLWRID
jgi:hypothetical protein